MGAFGGGSERRQGRQVMRRTEGSSGEEKNEGANSLGMSGARRVKE